MKRIPTANPEDSPISPSGQVVEQPPQGKNFADLLKRLDKLERFQWTVSGEWVRFEQVKTMVRKWVAEQGAK